MLVEPKKNLDGPRSELDELVHPFKSQLLVAGYITLDYDGKPTVVRVDSWDHFPIFQLTICPPFQHD